VKTPSHRGFRQDFHNLRAVAIILIVGAHTLPSFNWQNSPAVFQAFDVLCNEASVIFFFIAGFLFHHLSGRFQYGSYLRNKFLTVIVPYLLLSLPAIILFVYFIPKYNAPWGDEPAWIQFVMYYITGRHLAPLWFVPTITLFYIAAPLLLFADRKLRWTYGLLPIAIAISVYLGRDAFWGPLGKAAYLLPAYFGGMFVSRYRDDVEAVVRSWLWPLVGVCVAIYIAMFFEALPKSTHIVLKLLSALVFLHALRYFETAVGNSLKYVADISFGIFFVHAYLIGAIAFALTSLTAATYATGQDAILPGSLAGYLVFTAAVFGLSVGSVWVCQKIFGARSRMLVGA
jgi:peptidoglycan/LPS O-acetylase OafA/YrhL